MSGARWKRRQARAAKLSATHPHAKELLAFYVRVLVLQEPLFLGALKTGTADAAAVVDGSLVAALDLEKQMPAFHRFIQAVRPDAPEATAVVAGQLRESPPTAVEVIRRFVSRRSLDGPAAALGCAPAALEFFPRAFLQPIVEATVARAMGPVPAANPARAAEPVGGRGGTTCPVCGWPPQLTLLRDGNDVRGQRSMMCALCESEWMFPRATCPRCGTTSTDQLQYHESDQWAHVRVEECQACRTYIKAIDLRANGLAVPVVDELASVELDLWAGESGLTKLQPNLLGL